MRTLSENRNENQHLIGQFLSAKIILSLFYIFFCVLFGFLVGYDEKRLWLVFLVATGFALSGIFLMLRSVFSGTGHYQTDSFLSTADKLLMIILLGSLAWGLTGRITSMEQVVALQNLCYVTVIGLTVVFLRRKLPKINLAFQGRHLTEILRKTLPYTGLILLTAICNRIDVVMIDFMREDGAFHSGIYAAGYRFLDASNMMGYMFGALLLPMYAHGLSNETDISELFKTSFKILSVMGIFISTTLMLYSKEIFGLFYNNSYIAYHGVLQAIILSLGPVMISHSVGSLLVAGGRLFALNVTYAGAILLNVVLNIIVIPRYGALGSAYTTFITELTLLMMCLFLANRFFNIKIETQLIKKLAILISMPFIWLLFKKLQINIYWIIEIILYSFTFLISIFTVKLLSVEDLKNLINLK